MIARDPSRLVSVAALAAAAVACAPAPPPAVPLLAGATPAVQELRGLAVPPEHAPRPAPQFPTPPDIPVPVTPNLPLPGFDLAVQTGLTVNIFGLSAARQRDVPELEGLVVASQTYLLEDGQSLFFLTDAPGNLDIWRLDMHTRQIDPMPWVNGPEDDTELALSLDARWLVFARGPAGKRQLARVDRHDPTQPVLLAPRVEGISFPSVDASGNLVAYVVDHGGQTDIELYDYAHARVLEPPFINSPANESFPWLFPDGRTIAFISDRNGNPDLYLADLAGGPLELTLANSAAQELAPAYIGGTLLEFASTRTGFLRLYTYDYARHVVDTLPY